MHLLRSIQLQDEDMTKAWQVYMCPLKNCSDTTQHIAAIIEALLSELHD